MTGLPPEIKHIPSVLHGDTTVECYLVKGERYALIDSGIAPTPQRDIGPVLGFSDRNFSEIDIILNTHGHPDHVGGNEFLRQHGCGAIAIHEADALYLTEPDISFATFIQPVVEAIEGNVEDERQRFIGLSGSLSPPDRILTNGDVIECGVGVHLHVLHLPGHTSGSAGFYWEEEGILFCGDAVPGLHTQKGKLPIIIDLVAYIASLKQLQQLEIHWMLSGHAYHGISIPPAMARQGGEAERFISESLEFAENLHNAIQQEASTGDRTGFVQFADNVIHRLPEAYGIIPLSQVDRPMITPQSIYFALAGV